MTKMNITLKFKAAPAFCGLLLALLAFSAQIVYSATVTPAEQATYNNARYDVLSFMKWFNGHSYGLPTTPAAQNRVVNDPLTITGPGDGNIWKSINGANKLLVSNVGNYAGYNVSAYSDISGGKLNQYGNVWVTLAPELANRLQSAFPAGNDPGSRGVWLRTIQAVGLSPGGGVITASLSFSLTLNRQLMRCFARQ
ncbi:MAG: hypothetical protein LBP55_03520 [Candidatus Adiutrix sp.]|nr:hypothetical protein [Candidatus Adiutrix sp.]